MSTRRKVQPDLKTMAKAARTAEIKAEESELLTSAINEFIRTHLEQRLITTRLEADELRAELDELKAASTTPNEDPTP